MRQIKMLKVNFLWIFLIISSIINTSFASSEVALYRSESLRDPFKPLSTGEKREINGLDGVEGIQDIQINGIVFDPVLGSIVVINDIVMQEGQSVSNVTVIKIRKDNIEFEINGINQTKHFQDDEQS